jgi:hypothetical protein
VEALKRPNLSLETSPNTFREVIVGESFHFVLSVENMESSEVVVASDGLPAQIHHHLLPDGKVKVEVVPESAGKLFLRIGMTGKAAELEGPADRKPLEITVCERPSLRASFQDDGVPTATYATILR